MTDIYIVVFHNTMKLPIVDLITENRTDAVAYANREAERTGLVHWVWHRNPDNSTPILFHETSELH